MRLAGVVTRQQANELAQRLLMPQFNRRFAVKPASASDAHRPLGPGHNLAAILSVQHQRVVANDYTVRFQNRIYQVGQPVYPGRRQGRVIIELRLDGSMAIRFGDRYLKYEEVTERGSVLGGSAPQTPRSLPHSGPTPAEAKTGQPSPQEGQPAGVQPAGGTQVALLRSPILPTAPRRIARRGRVVQPQITPGGRASNASDSWLTPDIFIGRRRGHFYFAVTIFRYSLAGSRAQGYPAFS